MDDGLRTRFAAHFGGVPDGTGTGFGRVNIIGDHTDYNDGFVMPCILSHRTEVAIRARPDRLLNGLSGASDRQRHKWMPPRKGTGWPMPPARLP